MSLLALIPGVTTLRNGCIILLALSLYGTGAGLYGYHKGKVKTEAVAAQKALAIASQRETEARVASENYRRLEADLRDKADTAKRKYDAIQVQHVATLAAAKRDTGKLRDQLAAYASGGAAPGDSCATERSRAEALGVLLANGLRLQDELANGAETASDSVRALEEAWPKP
jgi:hypothetical protein